MRWIAQLAIALGCLAGAAHAQCALDRDADGHPLFLSTLVHTDLNWFDDGAHWGSPVDVAFGDLDADGDTDAAFVINETTPFDYVTVALNRGDAVFDNPVPYLAGEEIAGLALGDVDGDGDLDLVAANDQADTITLLLNDGNGTFKLQGVYELGDEPASIVAADFNADGLDDLAVLNVGSNNVSILLGAGGGGLAEAVSVGVGGVSPRGPYLPFPPPKMDAADVDADADIDLAVPAEGEVKILLNDGAGGFDLSPHVPDPASANAHDVALVDLDADGRLDLASVASAGEDEALSVMFQNADGSWTAPDTYSADFFGCPGCFYLHVSVAAGDIDGDGAPDLVVGEGTFDVAGVYLNDGAGAFSLAEKHATARGPWVVELEDLNADGWLDLAILDDGFGAGDMHVHLNDGAGTLIGPPKIPPEPIVCNDQDIGVEADMDLDGDMDVVVALGELQDCATDARVYANDGAGGFTIGAEISLGLPNDVTAGMAIAGDLNGDVLPEIVVADGGYWEGQGFEPGFLWVIPNLGRLEFGEPVALPLVDAEPFWIRLADIDADADLDVVAWTRGLHPGDPEIPSDRSIEVFVNDGAGALSRSQRIVLEQLPAGYYALGVVEAADLDGDGDLDLLATSGGSETPGHLWRLNNNGTGTFAVADVIDVGIKPSSIAIADYDADGDPDAALMYNHASTLPDGGLLDPYLQIFANDGNGNLTESQSFVNPNVLNRWSLRAADFNADGYPDLALPGSGGSLRVHLNQGDATFGPGASYDALDPVAGQAVADFDGDGRTDVALISQNDGIQPLFNRACPPCPADMNADGRLDVLDFITFQQGFLAGDDAADCDGDGRLGNPADFVCFQQLFQEGCP